MKTTARTIATAMVKHIEAKGCLPQTKAVQLIQDKFGEAGEEFLYVNNNDNLAIEKEVLDAFRELTEDWVVWKHAMWRLREPGDYAGRSQDV